MSAPGNAAGHGALDRLNCFVHGDAIDREITSRFVCGKGDAPDIHKSRSPAIGSPGNCGDAGALNSAILLPYLEKFATSPTVACKRRAE